MSVECHCACHFASAVIDAPLQFLCGLCVPAAHAAEPATKPNIILILADDLGLGNVGVYGGPFKTPSIDKLAREGLRFSQC